MKIPILETNRLILRGFSENDFEAYAEMCSDSEVMNYISTGKMLTKEESWRSLAFLIGRWHLKEYGMWAVEEKNSGNFVGRVGLFNLEGWPGVEVGWTLVKSAWGQGYATEAAKISVQWGFEHTNTKELISLIIPENLASIKVSERIGQSFSKEISIQGIKANLYSLNREAAT